MTSDDATTDGIASETGRKASSARLIASAVSGFPGSPATMMTPPFSPVAYPPSYIPSSKIFLLWMADILVHNRYKIPFYIHHRDILLIPFPLLSLFSIQRYLFSFFFLLFFFHFGFRLLHFCRPFVFPLQHMLVLSFRPSFFT